MACAVVVMMMMMMLMMLMMLMMDSCLHMGRGDARVQPDTGTCRCNPWRKLCFRGTESLAVGVFAGQGQLLLWLERSDMSFSDSFDETSVLRARCLSWELAGGHFILALAVTN
jgi:hypothetical protein